MITIQFFLIKFVKMLIFFQLRANMKKFKKGLGYLGIKTTFETFFCNFLEEENWNWHLTQIYSYFLGLYGISYEFF